jgi:trk system potassium uptake protein TrkH
MATDCGFASTDFDKWPIFAPLWMLFLSCITASSGSTGGGIKMMRTLILAKQAAAKWSPAIHPAAVNPVKLSAARRCPNKVAHRGAGLHLPVLHEHRACSPSC